MSLVPSQTKIQLTSFKKKQGLLINIYHIEFKSVINLINKQSAKLIEKLFHKACIISKTYITVHCTLLKTRLKLGYKYNGALHLNQGAEHRYIGRIHSEQLYQGAAGTFRLDGSTEIYFIKLYCLSFSADSIYEIGFQNRQQLELLGTFLYTTCKNTLFCQQKVSILFFCSNSYSFFVASIKLVEDRNSKQVE